MVAGQRDQFLNDDIALFSPLNHNISLSNVRLEINGLVNF